MFLQRSIAGGVAALVLLAAVPARADDGATVAAKLNAAMAKTTSFELQTTLGVGTSVSTVDRTKRMVKSTISTGSATVDMVAANGVAYFRVNGGDWQARALPQSQAEAMMKSMTESATVKLLPDRSEGGVTAGVVQLTTKIPAAVMSGGAGAAATDTTATCSYDKTTYLLRTCTMQLAQPMGDVVMTYGKWNDPANVVTVPAGVATPAPAPAATGTPAAK